MKTYRFATTQEILTAFGQLVKKNRINRNLTQKEFARSLGMSPNQLSVIERTGNTSMVTLIKLLKKLDYIDPFMDTLDVNIEFNPYDIPKRPEKFRVKHPKKGFK